MGRSKVSLIVEDGSGIADAESYASAASADSYFSRRGNVAWGGLTTAAKEAALRLATDYMGATYGRLWRSCRRTDEQALDWPRVGWAGVPMPVMRACCELAFRASGGPLIIDEGPQVASEEVGPIAVAYAEAARQNVRYAHVWALLGPFLNPHLIVMRG